MNMPAIPVLIVEDDPQIGLFLKTSLEAESYSVRVVHNGRAALDAFEHAAPALIVLDLGLPDMDGVAVIESIRARSNVPILVLSARSEEKQKIAALDAGADDYLTKPFGVGELLARVRVALRHRPGATPADSSDVIATHDLCIDFDRHEVTRAGRPIHLTPIEFRLLGVLAHAAGRVVTHRQLLRETWGAEYVEHTHYLRIYMGQLRAKLEDDPAAPRFLVTETGIGYRFRMD